MPETVKTEEKKTENNPDFAARVMAVQAYYQISQNQQSLRGVIEEYVGHRKEIRTVDGEIIGKPNMVLFKKILIGLDDRLAEVDEILRGHVKAEPDRISEKPIEPLLKAVLMCGIAELLNHTEINKKLIINDYLNVCHSFYEKGQVSFVNGILDSVAKLLRS